MRRKSRTIVWANGTSLEFIVHAPLGKHEPCQTPPIIRSRSRSVDAGTRSMASPKSPDARSGYIIFAGETFKRRTNAPPSTTPVRSFTKIVGKHEATSKTEKPKMARNSDCSRYHLFDIVRLLVS
jgi:hypothetical protein